MLEIVDLTYRIGGRVLLDHASAQVPAGHRVGLVGRNGTGKSTLLKLITREVEPDGGAIRLPKATRIGVVAQEAPGGVLTPLEIVLAADTERAALLEEAETATDPDRVAYVQNRLVDIDAYTAPARAAEILNGLGFDHVAQEQPMSSFSGGWRMRVALAAALFAEPDLLLLDEPTNHLDIEAAMWLEGFLKVYPKTLVMVSHDRDFLNAVANSILHLDDEKLTLYGGDYDTFEKTRREKLAQVAAMAAKQDAQRKHMQAFIDRFRAKASKARQAQSRIKALARMDPIAAIGRDASVRFDFADPEALAPPLISLDRASVGYGGPPILKGLDLRVDPDDRIALLGANGNGKSTLVKLLAGRLAASTGGRHASSKLRVGFFAQHQVDDLDLEATPLQAMMRAMGDNAREQTARGRLGGFGFGQERCLTKIGRLSGGEKARLTLALITHDAPHLLVLDEPTNHLDIESRDALIEALSAYTGAVLLVSHDRHMVELIADRLWLVADGVAEPYEGDVDDYRRQVLRGEKPSAKANAKAQPKRPANDPEAKARIAPLKKAAKEAEAAIAKWTAEKEKLAKDLADPAIQRGPRDRVTALSRAAADADRALAQAEESWVRACEELERYGVAA